MARYVYDEIKKELFNNDRSPDISAIIIRNMSKVCKEKYNCKAPGEIKEEKIDEYKQFVKESIISECDFTVALMKRIMKVIRKRRKDKKLSIAYDYASK